VGHPKNPFHAQPDPQKHRSGQNNAALIGQIVSQRYEYIGAAD
jgi:hypothetical protein